MKEQERKVIVDQLAASRDRMLALIGGLSRDQWHFHPAEGRWSIAECVEHVTKVENRVCGNFARKIADGAAEPAKADPSGAKDAVVAQAITDRSTRREAPEPVRPVGQWSEPGELLAHFGKTRADTLEFAASTQVDVRTYFMPHALFGELDGYQWLLALGLHGDRHARQIEEIKATPGFPS